jgi:hypothetical protein
MGTLWRSLSLANSTSPRSRWHARVAFLVAATKEDGERLRFIASEHKDVRRVLTITGVDELFGGI